MREDMEFNILFCEEVENFPVLYDYNRADYSNRSAQYHTWLKISQKFDAIVSECKDRWKNIRGSYSKYKAKLKTNSGHGRKGVKEYYLAPHLHFLDPFLKSRQSKSNINDDTEDEAEITEKFRDDDSVVSHNTTTSEQGATSSKAPSPGCCVYDEQSLTKPSCSVSSNEGDYRKRRRTSGATAVPTINDVHRKAFQYFEKKEQLMDIKNSSKNMTSEPPDPDMSFLQSVLPDMKMMNDSQKRHFKMGILKLADQILTSSNNDSHS